MPTAKRRARSNSPDAATSSLTGEVSVVTFKMILIKLTVRAVVQVHHSIGQEDRDSKHRGASALLARVTVIAYVSNGESDQLATAGTETGSPQATLERVFLIQNE